ncbi:Flp pilus assembly protein TadB [Anaerovibrio sp. JC8]|uniref:type II secretion system F family protein n=1 Tax=Anaerovibrio sp. JC8 TaxID=1240085 RepID=UPI000A0A28A5|nr:type II secretion system F family protein [Anaerovibrio sp. JC8]ORU01103.1 Flp pilus assembly protein TadB [Anaerovibrio sp. JC8]
MIFKLMIALLAALIVFSIFMFFLGRRNSEKQNIKERIAYFADYRTDNTASAQKKGLGDFIRGLFHRGGEMLEPFKKSNSFDVKMQQADWPLTGTEFQLILTGLGIIGALVFFAYTLQFVGMILGFIFGALLGWTVLLFHIQRRQAAFTNQLSDMLKMIADAMRAGFSFMQAMEHVAREMDAPASREVQKLMRETNLRIPLETALENMSQRVQSKDFDLVVTAVLIQRQVGGNLSQVLDNISDTINARLKMRQEVKTLTSQGRLSGIILALLPVALAVFINSVNPGYLKPLFEEEIGHIAIGIAIFLEIIGFIVIKRIVNIDT